MADLASVDQLAREVADLQRQLLSLRLELAPDGPGGTIGSSHGFLECTVDQASFAVPLEQVVEAILMCALDKLPEAPPWVAGLLNYRGESVVVLDLAARLGAQPRLPLLSDLILVCRLEQRKIGLVVGSVGAVIDIDPLAVQPVSADVPHASYVMGVLPGPAEQVLLLRLSSLLATSGLAEWRE